MDVDPWTFVIPDLAYSEESSTSPATGVRHHLCIRLSVKAYVVEKRLRMKEVYVKKNIFAVCSYFLSVKAIMFKFSTEKILYSVCEKSCVQKHRCQKDAVCSYARLGVKSSLCKSVCGVRASSCPSVCV